MLIRIVQHVTSTKVFRKSCLLTEIKIERVCVYIFMLGSLRIKGALSQSLKQKTQTLRTRRKQKHFIERDGYNEVEEGKEK